MEKGIRKMKCDESTPVCMRCKSTGRICDGYSVAPALQIINFADDNERQSYKYLREKVLPRISSHYDQPFWGEWMLQISPFQPAIRHALMAVASVHESLLGGGTENYHGRYDKRTALHYSNTTKQSLF